jgi:hypothetical protein
MWGGWSFGGGDVWGHAGVVVEDRPMWGGWSFIDDGAMLGWRTCRGWGHVGLVVINCGFRLRNRMKQTSPFETRMKERRRKGCYLVNERV